MNDADFMRYGRQLLLEDVAVEGQEKLLTGMVPTCGLRLFDARHHSWRTLVMQKSSGCPVCGGQNAHPL